MSRKTIWIIWFGLASMALAACGGATPTPLPITPIAEVETVLQTPPPQLDPESLGKDTRDCYVPDPGYAQYVSLEDGYCLVYPGYFEPIQGDESPNRIAFSGPEHTGGPEPIRATLSVQVEPAVEKTLEQAVIEVVDRYPNEDILSTRVVIGGRPGEILEGIPGDISTRQAILLANQRIMTITLTPAGEDFPTARLDSSLIWSTILATMHFFTPEAAPTASGGLDTSVWAVTEFSGLGIRFLLPPDWQVNSLPDAFALSPREHNILDWIVMRTHPDLPTDDQATLVEALRVGFQERGVEYANLLSRDFNGFQAVSVMGELGWCQDHYIVAFGLVHQIAVHPTACGDDGVLVDEVVQAILDSINFSEATQ
jgi:hypothetical protein